MTQCLFSNVRPSVPNLSSSSGAVNKKEGSFARPLSVPTSSRSTPSNSATSSPSSTIHGFVGGHRAIPIHLQRPKRMNVISEGELLSESCMSSLSESGYTEIKSLCIRIESLMIWPCVVSLLRFIVSRKGL